jgi:hypothetical protein
MNNNTIIELREQDSVNLGSPGNFQTDLSQNIIINDGDIFQLNSAFIDTVDSSSGEIIIPEDIQININFTPYMTLWTETSLFKIDSNDLEPEEDPVDVNFKYVLPYTRTPSDTQFDYYYGEVSNIFVGPVVYNNSANPSLTPSPAFSLIYSYIDPSFQKQYLQFNIPSLNTSEEYNIPIENFISVAGSLTIEQPSQSFITQYNLTFENAPFSTVDGSYYLHKKYTFNTIIPKGSYNATELSLLISKKLSINNKNSYSPSGQLIENPFLKNLSDFEPYRPPVAPFNTLTNPLNTDYFFTTDSSDALMFQKVFAPSDVRGNTIFIGSEQLSLEFNQTTNKFQFTYLHSPVYDTETGQNISVRYIADGDNIQVLKSNGGIFFNSLSANFVSTGKSYDFWSGVLGFDVDSILVKTSSVVIPILQPTAPVIINTTSQGFLQRILPLVEGQHITTPYTGIDSAVIKKANDTWYYENKTLPFDSTVDTTNSINASVSLPRLLDRFSHFLIEIEAVMFNTMIGKTTNRTIKGICNKYMSYSAYTYVGEEGAIQYQHKGQPQVLKSIKVKILNARKSNNIPGLGTDNTFYFQLISAFNKSSGKT